MKINLFIYYFFILFIYLFIKLIMDNTHGMFRKKNSATFLTQIHKQTEQKTFNNNLEEKEKEIERSLSRNSRNQAHKKNLSIDKYFHNRTLKNSRQYSIDATIGNRTTVIRESKTKNLNVNLNVNLNLTNADNKRDRQIDEFIKNKLCKLDYSKIRNISKSPINKTTPNNILQYIKNCNLFKKRNVVSDSTKNSQIRSSKQTKHNSKYCSLNNSYVVNKTLKNTNYIQNTTNFNNSVISDEEQDDDTKEKFKVNN